MRGSAALLLLLLACACDPGTAPAEQVAEKAAEKAAAIVDPPPAAAEPLAKGRYAPRNECVEIADATDFRQQIIEAVQLRDTDALLQLVADDVKLDFGGGAGKAELRKRLGDPALGLWRKLDALLPLGCAKGAQGGITIPWIFAQDPPVDPFAGMLVTGEDVSVLPRPVATAAPIGTVSWDVVEVTGFEPEAAFQRIMLPDKREGFIASDKLRSLVDYRLLASSRNGVWSVTSFVAGD
ncbi:MAG: hypothetical protein B7Z08_10580 [Sphingomonadales bacterium 32-68-7]|nr:MAG: hypothetical protein B7Z33_05520 [Sphingomonadales bacterium 12-68-11]OYX08153.1 MAG: hypothetical protein B7Z08_10580 [Sphingomonadales bacterium 32-68-7]